MPFIKPLILFLFLGLSQFASAQVSAQFSADTTRGCSPVTINFIDQSTGTNLRYLWSFGNGNVSSKQNPQAIYYLPGKYTVSLTITDSTGKKSSKTSTQYITVFKNPTAEFSASNVIGCVPFQVELTNKSTQGDTSFLQHLWDLGDGNTTTTFNPKHSYVSDGKFNVSLLVTDKNLCQSKIIKSNFVELKRTPVIEIEADKQFSCTAPLTVNFTDKSTKTASTDYYLWQFGDGSTSTDKNPKHTYTANGRYSVTLKITTSDGCKGERTFTNFVNIGGLSVDFDANIKNACAPVEITFTNKTNPSGLKSKWTFSDGAVKNGYNVTHTFTAAGSYNVTLEVEESATCKDSKTKNGFISIIDAPIAEIDINDTLSCKKPHFIVAYNKSKNANNFEWFIDDKPQSKQSPFAYTFADYGEYKLTLEAKNEYDCSDKETVIMHIKPPTIVLEADKHNGCKDLTVTFYDKSVLPDQITSKTWTFGDGSAASQSLDNSVTHTFKDTGTFKVKLQIKTLNGCIGEAEIEIKVGMKTNPTFNYKKDSLCNGTEFFAENTTNLDTPNLHSVKWHIYTENPFKEDSAGAIEEFYLPNSKSRTADDLHHKLDHDSGWYNVALITEHNGCFDTSIVEDAFYIKNPKTVIETLPFNPCNYSEVTLVNKSKGADSIVWRVYSQKHPFYTSSNDTIVIKRLVHGNASIQLSSYNFKSGCVHTKSSTVEFPETFKADFSHSGDACAPAHLNFSVVKTDSMRSEYTYEWRIANRFSDSLSIYNRFESAGTYNVTLFVTQVVTQCKDSITKPITITGPDIEGDLKYKGSCAPIPLELKLTSAIAKFDSVYWDIDGRIIPVTSNSTIFDTLYKPGPDSAGYYSIKLVGLDSNGCVGMQSFPVKVEGPTTPFIKIRRFTGCEGNRFIFNAEVPGYEVDDFNYEWDLGNGDTSHRNIVNAYYPANNKYTVKLKLIEKNGCTTTISELIDIEKEKLYASFEADGLETNCPPLFVEFTNKSLAKGRKITSYFWEFGDGSTSVEEHPSKLYLTAGKFTVKLFIKDEWGCEDSIIFPDFVLVNGPEGSYTLDKDKGCVPLTVNFTSTTSGTNFFEWDMGDGNVIKNKDQVTHTYNQPGAFIPLLILSDTFGCSYTLPPIDTIYVDPYPDPDFVYYGTCINYPIEFTGFSYDTLGVTDYLWEMIGSNKTDTLKGKSVNYTFYNLENPKVALTITSPNGCANRIEKTLKLNKLELDFTSFNTTNCVGSTIRIKDQTYSDTNIIYTKWIIDGKTSFEQNPSFFADKIGPVNITLIHENSIGCRDTLRKQTIIVGDTIPPKDVDIWRVTVNDNQTVQMDYAKAQFSDFQSYLIYKDLGTNYALQREEIDRNKTTFLSIGNNTLANSYCYKTEVKNTCGLISDTLTANTHCTINVEATGGENHNIVDWNHYFGWDSVATYTILRQEVDIPGNWRELATISGGLNTYIDSMVYCNINYAYRIQATEYQGNNQISLSDTAHAMPTWSYIPPPNKLIRATVEEDKEILIEWSESANSQIPIAEYVLEKSRTGDVYTTLTKTGNATFDYVDKEVAVDNYSYFYRTYAIDECLDTSEVFNFGKTILLVADTTYDQRPLLNWSTYQGWTENVDYYIIEIKNPDKSFTQIGSTRSVDSTLIDLVTNLNQRPEYCYRIIGYKELVNGEKQIISISNEDCTPVHSKVFFPNAFTPTHDNLNERYVTPGIYIKEYHITIFNRWGEKVFESFSMDDNWDGNYQGKPAQQDAYAVIVETVGVDLVKKVHFGTITLLR